MRETTAPRCAESRLPIVARRSPSLDAAELPCVDCHVGEPHVCRWLYWTEVAIEQDEWGGYVIAN